VFIGYEHGSKAWIFYDLITKCVHVSRVAIFEEDRAWDCKENGESFKMEYVPVDGMLRDDNTAWPGAPQGTPSPGVHRLDHAEPFTPPTR
jgi:hypothetical protein